jgi:hypothetical protein
MFNEVDNPNRTSDSQNTDANTTEPKTHSNSGKQYKNIETSVNNRDYFDEDHASKEEDQISNEEAASEKNRRPGA